MKIVMLKVRLNVGKINLKNENKAIKRTQLSVFLIPKIKLTHHFVHSFYIKWRNSKS